MKTMIIGIAGPSGCGKTTIAGSLVKHLPDIGLTGQAYDIDCCYMDLSHLSVKERSRINFDHPSSLDICLCANQLKELKQGRPIRKPIYDFTKHNRKDETEPRKPTDIVIVEGIHALSAKEIRENLDLSIYVTTDINTCLRRRKTRDINERNRTPDFVDWQIKNTVLPMYEEFILPSKSFADHLVDWDDDTSEELKAILEEIKTRFDNNKNRQDNY